MSLKKKLIRPATGGINNIFCPFCNCPHSLDSRWSITWENKLPTIKPSIQTTNCHYRIINGMIHDCKSDSVLKMIKF